MAARLIILIAIGLIGCKANFDVIGKKASSKDKPGITSDSPVEVDDSSSGTLSPIDPAVAPEPDLIDPKPPVPDQPSAPEAVGNVGSVTLTFDSVEGLSYDLLWSEGDSISSTPQTELGINSPHVLQALTAGSRYSMAIRASNAGGTSSLSPSVNVMVRGVPGTFDQTFGDAGRTIIDIPAGGGSVRSLLIDSQKRIVAAGSTFGASGDATVVRLLQNGTIDPTFGTSGIAVVDVVANDATRNATLTAAGKILLSVRSASDFSMLQLKDDGQPDGSFGTAGIQHTDFFGNTDQPWGVIANAEGSVFQVGFSSNGVNSHPAVLSYDSTGALRTGWANSGKYVLNQGGTNGGFQLPMLQADGKLVLSGYTANITDFLVARLNTDGTPDTSLNTTGNRIIDLGATDYVSASTLDDQGRILLGGQSTLGGSVHNWHVMRLNSDGSDDITFGTNSLVKIAISSNNDYVEQIVVAKDGSIFVCGSTTDGTQTDGVLAKLNSSGQIVTSFGNNGLLVDTYDGLLTNNLFWSCQMDSEGRILAGGYVTDAGKSKFSVVRIWN